MNQRPEGGDRTGGGDADSDGNANSRVSRGGWEQRLPAFLHPPALLRDRVGLAGERVVTPRLALLFAGAAALLLPWTVTLFLTLPAREQAQRWNIAWGGFDALLILVFTGAAVRILRLSPKSAFVNAAAATLLVVDAWFDIMTAPTTSELVQALLMAALVELPMAALCARTALRVLSLLEQARPYLVEAGFTVHNGRLVPPPPDPSTPPGAPSP
ncbi:hypothetical protein CFP65_1575 [Kitasatospora sp. MMS16-BH015]|uniref:hypothetical protein n=1 Tax=Kitasatospora sp. MMS16-BH015 TaxID=2018025 RepID=UPI000CA1D5D0|nr:hypothetical protein [Kitasatospora sp. MMS16-BH015]AUG76463.1 hypothetical protein CFP65_1575 [Kitasatospora sp. MMS16-BH015]